MHTEYGVPNIIKQINDHMHPTTKFEVREREFNIKIKEEATKTQLASRTVISEALSQLDDDTYKSHVGCLFHLRYLA